MQDAVHQAWQQIELQLNDVQQSALALYEQGTADIERVTEYIAVRVQSPDDVLDQNEPVREVFRR